MVTAGADDAAPVRCGLPSTADRDVQERAAVAAQQLSDALQRDTASDKNFWLDRARNRGEPQHYP